MQFIFWGYQLGEGYEAPVASHTATVVILFNTSAYHIIILLAHAVEGMSAISGSAC
jgi:hypothetical protein